MSYCDQHLKRYIPQITYEITSNYWEPYGGTPYKPNLKVEIIAQEVPHSTLVFVRRTFKNVDNYPPLPVYHFEKMASCMDIFIGPRWLIILGELVADS